jgi:hypothetical protein
VSLSCATTCSLSHFNDKQVANHVVQLLSYIKNNFLSLHACVTNRWMLFTGFDATGKKKKKKE